MLLNREVLRSVLQNLAGKYPQSVSPFKELVPEFGEDVVIFSLSYLDEHGLTDTTWSNGLAVNSPIFTKITSAGIDFMADDGGLSAILNVVTVKLHSDTIKSLLIERIEKSEADATVKEQLKDRIKSLPAETLQQVSVKAMEAGLDRLPDLAQWLGKLIFPS